MNQLAPTSSREASALLRELHAKQRRVRIQGLGTRAHFVAPLPEGAATLSLRSMSTIERLEKDDLTCSVQPGVRCSDLRSALDEAALELDCLDNADEGTIGGLYASDPLPCANPHAASPRSTLLGIEGALACGSEFRSGARVVKSVAGFDVHRLLVGSRGRLFAATLLHLKLRPAPRDRAAFASERMDLKAATQALHALRCDASAPKRLVLTRDGDAATLRGVASGMPRLVAALLLRHSLRRVDDAPSSHLPTSVADRELIVGAVRPSRLPALFAALPPAAPLLVHGGGHFECELDSAHADLLFAAMPRIGGHAAVALGQSQRIGIGTRIDSGAERLQRDLCSALDPSALLA